MTILPETPGQRSLVWTALFFPLFAFACATTDESSLPFVEPASIRQSLSECDVEVGPLRSIEIVHPNVVNDARASSSLGGPWSFRTLIENMAPSPGDTDAFLRSIVESWLVDHVVNGDVLRARPGVQFALIDQFVIANSNPRRFDLSRAPFALLAIANRLDLRAGAQDAGEGRFVFGLTSPFGGFQSMTLILEYKLPLAAPLDTAAKWAAKWHELDAIDPATDPATFNAKLQEITAIFTRRGAFPGRPNGSAISQIRTNEISFGSPWQLREFNMTPQGWMVPATTKVSPNQTTINGSQTLLAFIEATPELASETDTRFMSLTMPELFDGQPFLGGQADQFVGNWFLPNGETTQNSVRLDNFGILTCNGCHSESKRPDDVAFYHVIPTTSTANPVTGVDDGTGRLSKFMLFGDPSKGGRRPAELTRRADDMVDVLCTGGGRAFAAGPSSAVFEVGLTAGQSYVEVFLKKNGVAVVATAITTTEAPLGNGLSIYRFEYPQCSPGDRMEYRFYSYLPTSSGVFTPGEGPGSWYEYTCGD